MKTDWLAVSMLLACACSAPKATPTRNPPDVPVLHGAPVHGPFPDEATLCKSVYEGQSACLTRPSQRVIGPTSTTTNGFGSVEIVDAGLYDNRCALLFHVADRFYVNDHPDLCLSTGHSLYTPKVREMAFRDLDGMNAPELVIIADVEIVYDEMDDAPARTSPPIPPITVAIVCGVRGTPSCVTATTSTPDAFLATHKFSF